MQHFERLKSWLYSKRKTIRRWTFRIAVIYILYAFVFPQVIVWFVEQSFMPTPITEDAANAKARFISFQAATFILRFDLPAESLEPFLEKTCFDGVRLEADYEM